MAIRLLRHPAPPNTHLKNLKKNLSALPVLLNYAQNTAYIIFEVLTSEDFSRETAINTSFDGLQVKSANRNRQISRWGWIAWYRLSKIEINAPAPHTHSQCRPRDRFKNHASVTKSSLQVSCLIWRENGSVKSICSRHGTDECRGSWSGAYLGSDTTTTPRQVTNNGLCFFSASKPEPVGWLA